MENQSPSLRQDTKTSSKSENRKILRENLIKIKNSNDDQIVISKDNLEDIINCLEYLESECSRLRRSL